MSLTAELAVFAHVVRRPDEELDLAQAALLIAESEYPGLDVSRHLEHLDRLGAEASLRLGASSGTERLARLLRYLYEELGFAGNSVDYYDPRNSFLNEVLERRVGIPITLAVVLMEIGRRAGVIARGIGFPGHFLVETPASGLIDPFDGRQVGAAELRELHRRATGDPRDPDPKLLEPATKAQILVRMLNNLRSIYASRSDHTRVRAVVERIHVLSPSEETRRQLEVLGGRVTPPPPLSRN